MLIALTTLFSWALVTQILGHKLIRLFAYVFAALLIVFLFPFYELPQGHLESLSWFPQLGVNINLKMDGLSLLFSTLVLFIGSGVFIYAADYMKSYQNTKGMFSTLMVFTAAMLGLVLSDNLVLFFIFWELTSVTSYLLVAFKSHDAVTRDSARTALFVTVGGGLMLLVGTILLSLNAQSLGLTLEQSLLFSELKKVNLLTGSSSLNLAALLCFAITIATKSAQFPFHFWLPFAMAGPTPVSSFLHSAAMVKAGIFLLMRLTPLYSNHPWWDLFTIMGAITMIFAAVMALAQKDIKKILAYTTISVLGILVMLVGLATEYSLKAAIVFMTAHALYKAAFFQLIGNVDVAFKNRDIYRLSGLYKYLPISAVAVTLSALSMAGVPPFFGFFGKEVLYFAKIGLDQYAVIFTLLALITNILLTGAAFAICFQVFLKKKAVSTEPLTLIKKNPLGMSLPPLVYSLVGITLGLFPALFYKVVGTRAYSDLLGNPTEMKLKLWHGTSPDALLVLGLSITTLALGAFIALKIRSIIEPFSVWRQKKELFDFKDVFDRILEGCMNFAVSINSLVHHGSLKNYLRMYMVAISLIVLFTAGDLLFAKRDYFGVNPFEFITGLLLSAPIVSLIFLKGKLSQTILLAVGGVGLVFMFAIYSALDVALTQLMVESLSIFFLFFLLKRSINFEKKVNNTVLDYFIAFSFSFVLMLSLLISPVVKNDTLRDFFLKNSLPKAFGENVVNVILVDFRALDTFGEVIVIVVAMLSIYLLLSQREPEAKK